MRVANHSASRWRQQGRGLRATARRQWRGLARRIPEVAFLIQHHLIAAAKQPASQPTLLRDVDGLLAELRLLLRLARDAQAISFKQYEEGARRLGEIGRLLGGWLRKLEELSPAQRP